MRYPDPYPTNPYVTHTAQKRKREAKEKVELRRLFKHRDKQAVNKDIKEILDDRT